MGEKAAATMTQLAADTGGGVMENPLIWGAIFAAVFVLFCLIFYWTLFSPVSRICKTLKDLSNGKRYDNSAIKQLTKRKGKIGSLAVSVDELAESYQAVLQNTETIFTNTAAGYLERRVDLDNVPGNTKKMIAKSNQTMDILCRYLDALPECLIVLEDTLGLTYSNLRYRTLQGKFPKTPLLRLILDGISAEHHTAINNSSDLEAILSDDKPEILWLDLNDGDRLCFSILIKRPSGTESSILLIASDITDLMTARDRANLANAAKSNFLSRVSHELRTPMNAVVGLSNLLLREGGDPKKTTQRLKKIVLASEHLMGIINDIVDMSKIEANQIEISKSPFVVRQLVQNCYDLLSYQAEEKDIKMSLHIPSDSPRTFVGDPARIRQTLINLVSNAIKFTNPGGSVDISLEIRECTDENTTVAFIIRDTGVGISKEHLGKLFIPFEQDSDYLSRRFQGVGLSLPITNNIINRMGGHIDVDSKIGEGSVFTVVVPFERAPEYDLPIHTARSDVPRHALTDLCMLLVDDVEINRVLIREVFARFDMHIEEAADGVEALEKFTNSPQGHYDIIFMDIQMPNMDGYETTRRIRALDRMDAASVPIIAMTANAMREDVARALECGLNDHMSKPLNFTECEHIVYRYCIAHKN